MNDFIIPLNKPSGVTSAKALCSVKYNVNKKVGHTGTLDKFASGLIIALTGKYTKLTERYMNLKKTYLATIEFGKETDTLDPEGEVIANSDYIPTLAEINKALSKSFSGKIMQMPPQYSALHVNGKRASDLTRQGEEVQLSEREINIYSSEVVSFKDNILVARFEVSRGTYIRSIARDLAICLNTRGYLKALVREKIGPFNLEDAMNADDREGLKSSYSLQRKSVVLALGVFDTVHLGHQKIIKSVLKHANDLNVEPLIITFNTSPKLGKGEETIISLQEKIEAIKKLGVDNIEVIEWTEELKKTSGSKYLNDLMKKYDIKKIVAGKDFSVGTKTNAITIDSLNLFFKDEDIVIEDYVFTPSGERVSTTYIRKLIKEGRVEEARVLYTN